MMNGQQEPLPEKPAQGWMGRFLPPDSGEDTYHARIVAGAGLILGGIAAIMLLSTLASSASDPTAVSDAVFAAMTTLFVAGALWFNRAGRVQTAAGILIGIILSLSVLQMVTEGNPPGDLGGAFGLLLAVVLARPLLTRRMAWIVAGFSAVVYAGLHLLWLTGQLPAPSDRTPFVQSIFVLATWITACTVVLIVVESALSGLQRQTLALEEQIANRAGAIREANQEMAKLNKAMLNMLEDLNETADGLKQQKEQAEAILQSAADAMAITNPEGVFLTVNPAFVRQTGYTETEAVGQHIRMLSGEASDSPSIRDVISAARSGNPWRMETRITRKDGSHFDADISMAPLSGDQGDQLRGFVVALHDVSLFKEVERIKDDFLSTAAHELRTPLTSIRGFSEILLTRELSDDRRKNYMETINSQSTQLAQIIDDLLDISRLEAGRGLDMKPQSVDMASLVAEAMQPFADTSPSHHFALEDLMDAPPVQGDPFRLSQVLRTLLSNAVKYSPEGGRVIVRGAVDSRYLAVSVCDEGIGLTPEQQAHLFERFYRADSTSRSIGGTGLGLTICKLIVEAHGGQIRAVSKRGVGSTFTFTVPLAGIEATTR